MMVFNLKVPHAEIKVLLLMTSAWKMWRGSFFWAAIPQSLPCFHTFWFTGCSEDAVQLFHARSPTTQMTYGASSVSPGPSSRSHFIKYKSQENIYKSKSCGSNMQRCRWDLRSVYIWHKRWEKKSPICDPFLLVCSIFPHPPKEGSVAYPRASPAAEIHV